MASSVGSNIVPRAAMESSVARMRGSCADSAVATLGGGRLQVAVVHQGVALLGGEQLAGQPRGVHHAVHPGAGLLADVRRLRARHAPTPSCRPGVPHRSGGERDRLSSWA